MSDRSPRRTFAERLLTILTLIATAWAVLVWLLDGFTVVVGPLRLASHAPGRIGLAAALLFAGRVSLGGMQSFKDDIIALSNSISSRTFVALLASSVFVAALACGSGSAVGSDSYGYVSQADLWLSGSLHVPQPAALTVPWPDGQWTFAPLGYRPSITRDAIVPTYPPGTSMVMALFKRIFGQLGIALVAPVTAAILIVVTYLIGRRVASAPVGAAAAWLLATSPTLLFSAMWPMSDVPAACFWLLALYGCLAGTKRGSALGGVAAGVAVLVRPNLIILAGLLALWLVWHDGIRRRQLAGLSRALMFLAPVAASALFIAFLNQRLYGSATTSGYGSFDDMFHAANITTNLGHYATWLATAEPVVLLGVIVLFLPMPRGLRLPVDVKGRAALALICAGVIGEYLFYQPFNAWWFLRFLLPAFPLLLIAGAARLASPAGTLRPVASVLLLCLSLHGLWYARRHVVFDLTVQHRRGVMLAQQVAAMTEPNSVIITTEDSGLMRFYGGRTTLRIDYLDAAWLDRVVAWLAARGVHTYILLEGYERQGFAAKFENQALGHLERHTPMLLFGNDAPAALYDTVVPAEGLLAPRIVHLENLVLPSRWLSPVPMPKLPFD